MSKTLSWSDITLGDFEEIQAISGSDFSELDKTIELLKIITHNEDIENLSVPEFSVETKKLSLLSTEIPHNKIKKQYKLGNTVYNCINNIKNITAGQYIDYCNLTKSNIDLSSIKKIVAILLIPEGHKYNNGYEIEDVENDVENYMSITDVFGISDFFKLALKKLSKDLLDFSLKTILRSELTAKEKIIAGIQIMKLKHRLRDLHSMV